MKIMKGKLHNKKVIIALIICSIWLACAGLLIFVSNKTESLSLSKNNYNSSKTEDQALKGKNSYISSTQIIQRKTGTGPFDINDNPGNDSSESNDIVRSFDQITYTIENTMALKSSSSQDQYKGGVIEVKAELPANCANFVKWDLSSMAWAENGNVSDDGRTFTAEYTMPDKEITIPGKQTLVLVLKVLGAPNGLQITPTFTMSLYGNNDADKKSFTDGAVKVSATPKYDIDLKNYDIGYSIDRNGKSEKIYKYGVGFKLKGDNESKGIKGIEVPTGDLTFDIDYSMNRRVLNTDNYTNITNNMRLYNYKYNQDSADSLGNSNNPINDLPSNLWMSTGTYPWSTSDDTRRSCYQNGNLKMVDNGNGKINVTISNYGLSDKFPDRNDWTTFPTDDQYSYSKDIGWISVGLFYMEVDMNDQTMMGNTQSYLELDAKNIKVNTVGGNVATQEVNTDNNSIRANHYIYIQGQYSKENHFYDSEDKNFLSSPWGAGNASSYLGSRVYLNNRITLSLNNDKKDWVHGADYLIKFDDSALEPVLDSNGKEFSLKVEYGTSDLQFNLLYAGKKDKSGWSSDSEMISTSMDNLVYFDTINELKSKGYKCVAVMAESTSGVLKSGLHMWVNVPFVVKQTAKVNSVAQVVSDLRLYNEANTPNRATQTHLKTTRKSDYPTPVCTFENLKYIKTAYNSAGQVETGTHFGGVDYGNSLLILGAEQSIRINTVNDSNEVKVNYDLGKGENESRIAISPIISSKNSQSEKPGNITLKIESTLPSGLTYIEGSSNYGEPEKTNNSDGSTTLVWKIYNCAVDKAINPIIFKAHINEETKNGTQYEVKAITSEVLNNGENAKLGNSDVEARTSRTYLQIINLSSYSLYKNTDTPVIEMNGTIHYKVMFLNKTDEEINDFYVKDILPYNGDSRGTSYNGTYKVQNITAKQTITSSGQTTDNSNLKMYVTNDSAVRDGDTSQNQISWKNASFGEQLNAEETAYMIHGKIPARGRLDVDIYVRAENNKPNDVYKNSAVAQTKVGTELIQSPIVSVTTIKRMLEGRVWLDANKDGIKNDNESYVKKITLRLQTESGDIAKDIYGNKMADVVTDDNGYYKFEDMQRENYKVCIVLPGETYDITAKRVGDNDEINSKFNGDKTTDVISELNSISNPIVKISNVNAGIINKAASVTVHHYIDGTENKVPNKNGGNVEDQVINGIVGDTYSTKPSDDIDYSYEVVQSKLPKNASGTMESAQTVVTYYYKLKPSKVIINYIEKDNDKDDSNNMILSPSEDITGFVKDRYNTNEKHKKDTIEKDGRKYTLVSDTGNTEGTMTVDTINVTYYYLQNTKAKVRYVEQNPDDGSIVKDLEEPTVKEGLVGDEFVTNSKNFIGYKLVKSPEKTTIKLEKEEQTLIYYYVPVYSGVLENHIDEKSGKILDTKEHQIQVGKEYDIPSKEFEGYDLVQEKLPNNSKGTMGEELITVNYYYIKKAELEVNYIDILTNKPLADKVTDTTKHEGDEYKTEEKQFENYDLVKVDGEKEGTLKVETDEKGNIVNNKTIVTYYYAKRSAGVEEHHIDIRTGKDIEEPTLHKGHVGDDYDIKSKEFLSYKLVEKDEKGNSKLPENAKGKMEESKIVVNYYYYQPAKVIVHYVDKTTGKELEEENEETGKKQSSQVVIEGQNEDEYKTEAKNFKYYNLKETSKNTNGKMKVEIIKANNKDNNKIENKTNEGTENLDIVNNVIDVYYYYEPKPFNIQVSKEITGITVNGKKKEIKNGKLEKVEIYRKSADKTSVQVEYKIKVSNTGEVDGKATIEEDLPEGMSLAEDDGTWEVDGANNKLTKIIPEIKAGETKEYTVLLNWKQSGDNMGIKKNEVKLINTENVPGFVDNNNKDNTDSAKVVISVETGEFPVVLTIILIALVGLETVTLRYAHVLTKREKKNINKK